MVQAPQSSLQPGSGQSLTSQSLKTLATPTPTSVALHAIRSPRASPRGSVENDSGSVVDGNASPTGTQSQSQQNRIRQSEFQQRREEKEQDSVKKNRELRAEREKQEREKKRQEEEKQIRLKYERMTKLWNNLFKEKKICEIFYKYLVAPYYIKKRDPTPAYIDYSGFVNNISSTTKMTHIHCLKYIISRQKEKERLFKQTERDLRYELSTFWKTS